MTDNVDIVRRTLVTALSLGPFILPNILHANGSRVNFYYSRSGLFTAYGSDDVFAGGLLVAPDLAVEIEDKLAKRSRAAGFNLDLIIGTNRHLPSLLKLSLDILGDYQVNFFAAAVRTARDVVEPDVLTSVRTQYEADILTAGNDAGLFGNGFINLIGVRHARGLDDTIYARLLDRGLFSSVKLSKSHANSSNLYRLSSVLTKSIAAAHYNRALTKTRDEMRAVVLSRYEVADSIAVSDAISIIPIKKK